MAKARYSTAEQGQGMVEQGKVVQSGAEPGPRQSAHSAATAQPIKARCSKGTAKLIGAGA